MPQTITRALRENKSFILLLLLMFVFRSALADWNSVPTGSMKPTILEGDRIWVNKMAYDLRVPFTHISVLKRGDPKRGDIIVFDSEKSGIRLVKRVIGIPGDSVTLTNNVLAINGQTLEYKIASKLAQYTDKVENLLGIEHIIRIHEPSGHLSNFKAVNIPQDQYLVMGDNRDNSADSRVLGLVPRNEVVGRSRHVVMSFNYDNYYLLRSGRFFHRL